MDQNIYRKYRLVASKKRRRFSDASMAAYTLGISPSTLYRLERGEIAPAPIDVVNMFAAYESEGLLEEHCSFCPVRVALTKIQMQKEGMKKDNDLGIGNMNE